MQLLFPYFLLQWSIPTPFFKFIIFCYSCTIYSAWFLDIRIISTCLKIFCHTPGAIELKLFSGIQLLLKCSLLKCRNVVNHIKIFWWPRPQNIEARKHFAAWVIIIKIFNVINTILCTDLGCLLLISHLFHYSFFRSWLQLFYTARVLLVEVLANSSTNPYFRKMKHQAVVNSYQPK